MRLNYLISAVLVELGGLSLRGGMQLRIAICDDNKQELHNLLLLMRDYAEQHPSADIEMESFLSVEELSRQQPGRYQLLLLDIIMPQMSGIEFIRSLRTAGGRETVIFITSSADFALDAFSVNAVQYLLKPVNDEALYSALDKALLFVKRQQAGSMVVSTQEGVRNIYYHNIVYIECVRHFAYFHLSDQTTVCSRTLRQSFISYIAPFLADDRFVHTHHSFVVNKQYVTRLNQRNFELFGGHTVPISKDRLTEVKREYLNFVERNMEV